MIIERNDREYFDEAGFRRDHFGINSGTMGINSWSDLGYYFGCKVDEWELKHGTMKAGLYKTLAEKYGTEEMDKYFGVTAEVPLRKPLTPEEREIEELADLILYGRKQSR